MPTSSPQQESHELGQHFEHKVQQHQQMQLHIQTLEHDKFAVQLQLDEVKRALKSQQAEAENKHVRGVKLCIYLYLYVCIEFVFSCING